MPFIFGIKTPKNKNLRSIESIWKKYPRQEPAEAFGRTFRFINNPAALSKEVRVEDILRPGAKGISRLSEQQIQAMKPEELTQLVGRHRCKMGHVEGIVQTLGRSPECRNKLKSVLEAVDLLRDRNSGREADFCPKLRGIATGINKLEVPEAVESLQVILEEAERLQLEDRVVEDLLEHISLSRLTAMIWWDLENTHEHLKLSPALRWLLSSGTGEELEVILEKLDRAPQLLKKMQVSADGVNADPLTVKVLGEAFRDMVIDKDGGAIKDPKKVMDFWEKHADDLQPPVFKTFQKPYVLKHLKDQVGQKALTEALWRNLESPKPSRFFPALSWMLASKSLKEPIAFLRKLNTCPELLSEYLQQADHAVVLREFLRDLAKDGYSQEVISFLETQGPHLSEETAETICQSTKDLESFKKSFGQEKLATLLWNDLEYGTPPKFKQALRWLLSSSKPAEIPKLVEKMQGAADKIPPNVAALWIVGEALQTMGQHYPKEVIEYLEVNALQLPSIAINALSRPPALERFQEAIGRERLASLILQDLETHDPPRLLPALRWYLSSGSPEELKVFMEKLGQCPPLLTKMQRNAQDREVDAMTLSLFATALQKVASKDPDKVIAFLEKHGELLQTPAIDAFFQPALDFVRHLLLEQKPFPSYSILPGEVRSGNLIGRAHKAYLQYLEQRRTYIGYPETLSEDAYEEWKAWIISQASEEESRYLSETPDDQGLAVELHIPPSSIQEKREEARGVLEVALKDSQDLLASRYEAQILDYLSLTAGINPIPLPSLHASLSSVKTPDQLNQLLAVQKSCKGWVGQYVALKDQLHSTLRRLRGYQSSSDLYPHGPPENRAADLSQYLPLLQNNPLINGLEPALSEIQKLQKGDLSVALQKIKDALDVYERWEGVSLHYPQAPPAVTQNDKDEIEQAIESHQPDRGFTRLEQIAEHLKSAIDLEKRKIALTYGPAANLKGQGRLGKQCLEERKTLLRATPSFHNFQELLQLLKMEQEGLIESRPPVETSFPQQEFNWQEDALVILHDQLHFRFNDQELRDMGYPSWDKLTQAIVERFGDLTAFQTEFKKLPKVPNEEQHAQRMQFLASLKT